MSCIEDFIGKAPNKHFSNTVITWEVKRFPLIYCTQKLISSPVITLLGPVETEWRMHLDMTKKSDFMLKLEMVPNNTKIRRVKVHWACCVLDEKDEGLFSPERILTFEPKTKLVTHYFSRSSKDTLQMISKKPHDSLIIKCHMLVTFGLSLKYPNARLVGVMGLSNDLVGLPKSYLYNDIVTRVGNEEFSLHKAILYHYGSKIVNLLEQSSGMKVDFSLSDEKAAASIFSYLYTGDLRFILSGPSIAISDYIEHLEIPNLQNVYSPRRIKVSSGVELKQQTCNWTVTDFNHLTRSLIGPELKIHDMKSCFQLSLNIKEPTGKCPLKSLVVEANLLDTEKLLVVCIEFACGKNENDMLRPQRLYEVMGVGDRVGITLIKNDCPEVEEYFRSDTIVITTTVYIRIGAVLNDVAVESEDSPAVINYERSFMNLCKILGDLYKSQNHSDFHFEIDKKNFKSHKFFVAARSPLMKALFRRNENMESLKVYSCKEDVFDKFLCYMYTGILIESNADKLIELYNLGKQYSVCNLQNVVTSCLVKQVNDENMLNVLIFADDIQDDELKNAAINHILKYPNKLTDHRDYVKFLEMKPRIHLQIQQLVANESE